MQVSTQIPEAAAESTNVQIYSVRGVVQELKADSRTVVIKHEAVPDFMPAMTMPFEARDGTQLQNVAPGDEVTFRLHVSEQDNWIDEVRRTGKTSPVDIPGSETVRIIKPLKVGDAVPDYAFTNELGQPISLGQFKGKALVVTFIFTRCPVPNFCRRMSANFVEASEKLKAMKTPRNWHLLSISFDPEFDTPATLKQYAERYNYDPETWSFATSEMIDMDAIDGTVRPCRPSRRYGFGSQSAHGCNRHGGQGSEGSSSATSGRRMIWFARLSEPRAQESAAERPRGERPRCGSPLRRSPVDAAVAESFAGQRMLTTFA